MGLDDKKVAVYATSSAANGPTTKYGALIFTSGQGNTDKPETHIAFVKAGGGGILGQGWFQTDQLIEALMETS